MQVGDLIKVRYNNSFKISIVTKILHKYAVEILPAGEKTPFRVFPSEIVEVINENR